MPQATEAASSAAGRASQAGDVGRGRQRSTLRYLIGVLGPGLVTGAADDNPSGIATYAQTGAQFGQLWTALWMLPLVTAVQDACGRIGNVTGKGLARNIKDHYSLRTLRLLVLLLTAANLINIGGHRRARRSAALIIHIPASALMVAFTLFILTLEIVVSYRRYARVLKWLTVSLLAYPITAFFVPEPWGIIARATFVPHIEFSVAFFHVITAVIGTAITPYMFFWQASQEVEENQGRATRRSLRNLRTDNAIAPGQDVPAFGGDRPGPVPSRRRVSRHARHPRHGRVDLLRALRGLGKTGGPEPQAPGEAGIPTGSSPSRSSGSSTGSPPVRTSWVRPEAAAADPSHGDADLHGRLHRRHADFLRDQLTATDHTVKTLP